MRLPFWFLLAVVLSMELGVHLCSIQPSVRWAGTQTSWLQYDHCLSHSAVTRGMQCHLCKGFGGCSGRSNCPRNSTHCVIIATRSPISFTDLPLVTKMCYDTCPDVPSLGLGPHVSIVCCQSNLCNSD